MRVGWTRPLGCRSLSSGGGREVCRERKATACERWANSGRGMSYTTSRLGRSIPNDSGLGMTMGVVVQLVEELDKVVTREVETCWRFWRDKRWQVGRSNIFAVSAGAPNGRVPNFIVSCTTSIKGSCPGSPTKPVPPSKNDCIE